MLPAMLVILAIAVVYFLSASQANAADVQTPVSNVGGCQVLSFDVIRGLAQNAGFDSDSDTAAAIALAESGGKPFVLGDLSLAPSNGPAVGLWQINSAKHTDYTVDQLYDPQTNADYAYQIYSEAGGFSPWTTYKDGAYQQFLPA